MEWAFMSVCRHIRGSLFSTGAVRIPLIADTHSKLIADGVPGDRGHLQ